MRIQKKQLIHCPICGFDLWRHELDDHMRRFHKPKEVVIGDMIPKNMTTRKESDTRIQEKNNEPYNNRRCKFCGSLAMPNEDSCYNCKYD